MNDSSLLTPERKQAMFFEPGNKHCNHLWQGTAVMLAMLLVGLALWALDTRQLDGVSIWAKPLKFSVSIALHFVTLAVLAAFLTPQRQQDKIWQGLIWLSVAAGLFEILYIFLQATRGRNSHFNNATPIEDLMYGLMGIGAVTLIITSLYLGWLLYLEHQHGNLKIFKLASALGLMLGSVLTLIIAGKMGGQGSHFVSEPAANAITIPVVGWVLSGGDLRIPHFFATHLMQFLPLFGLWLHTKNVNYPDGKKWIIVFTGVYLTTLSGLFGFMLWQ